MPGDEAPEKIHTLPFVPPMFDWSAQNLYTQFRIFKTKVQFAFNGTGVIPMMPRLGQSLIGWVTLHSKCTITLYGIHLLTRMTLERFSLNLKITLNQLKMSIIASTCSEACIPPSSNLRVTS